MTPAPGKGWEDGWAIVPAAGVGSRLRPHTHTIPKALLSVAGKPILGHILDEVTRLDITRIALVVGRYGDQIVAYARDQYRECEIAEIRQETPQGLGHAVSLAGDCVGERPALIVYGDTIFEGDLSRASQLESDGAIGVRRVDDPSRFGVVQLEGSRIIRLVEKPSDFVSDLAIVGVNLIRKTGLMFACLDRLVKDGIRTRGEFQLTDAFSMMVNEGAVLEAFELDNWFDCGAPDAILETNRHLLSRLDAPAERDGVIVVPPAYIAASATVTKSVIGPHVSIGEGVTVSDSVIRDTILADYSQVRGCFLERSLIGEHAVVEAGARRLNVGDSSEVKLF